MVPPKSFTAAFFHIFQAWVSKINFVVLVCTLWSLENACNWKKDVRLILCFWCSSKPQHTSYLINALGMSCNVLLCISKHIRIAHLHHAWLAFIQYTIYCIVKLIFANGVIHYLALSYPFCVIHYNWTSYRHPFLDLHKTTHLYGHSNKPSGWFNNLLTIRSYKNTWL